jgi:hypothetical protein
MSEDDEIARLLREVDAATGGGSSATGPAKASQPPAVTAGSSAGKEVVKEGPDTGAHLLMAGVAGGVVGLLAAWIFGIIPLLGNVDSLRYLLAGFIGGAVGYGTGRILDRGKD